MAKLSLQHLSSREVPALHDFNLEVSDREFILLAGPPGCGTSSILRVIAGLDGVSKGDIYIGDKRVNDLPPKDRDIAMVFPSDALYPRMTVYENIAFGLKLRKFPKPEIKKRITEAAAILGIEQHLDRKPAALSPAARQRVSITRAVVRQPKVFLFDDPLSRLDPEIRVQMRTELIRLHQRLQATFIYATRDQAEATAIAGRIVLMRDGVIQQSGPPLSLYREPANLFVAGFLGNPPMNFIRGKLRESGDALLFKETGDGVIEIKLAGRPEAHPFAGREIIAGVRPEDIEIVTGPPRPGVPRFRCLLDVVEPIGAEACVHLETGAHTLIARARSPIGKDEAGHRVQFEINAIHLFDPETARRITA
jgi:multiple sugar transport system ATP-binding protein